ncbi:MAG: hypothetical protein LQ349_006283 [Xanthoria aureola]|nr:MAG: hypothetical protein LQ349_006283 [Xanthoria aureola]
MAAVYKSLTGSSTKNATTNGAPAKKNKQRVLILSSRGVTFRQRHLLNDLYALLPHSRKDAKLDTKTKLYQLNELADLYNCNNVLFFEARKGKDLYIWMSKAPNGPTVKCHMQNLHTTSELHFPGNCLRGSRPILSFDATFDSAPHLILIKELLTHVFGVPKGARKTKPFVDHVMGFTLADGKIWIRCFEIRETAVSKAESRTQPAEEMDKQIVAVGEKGETKINLVEIGPRFLLTPIVILESSFGGPVIYENKEFVSPNQIRSELRLSKAGRYNQRAEQQMERKAKKGDLGLSTGKERPNGELEDRVLFA